MIADLERLSGRSVSRETLERLQAYARLLLAESERQNLIAASTVGDLWERHILDSAQLVRFAPEAASWLDIGSGAGLPGVVVACATGGPITLVEPRRLRAEFLEQVVSALDLNATVICAKAERVTGTFDVITARAVAPLAKMLGLSSHLSTRKTLYVLPKGRTGASELAEARRAWQGSFHVEPSLTDDDSVIILGTGVEAKRKR